MTDIDSGAEAPAAHLPSEMEPGDYVMFRAESNPRRRSTGMGLEILDRVPDWDGVVEAFDRASRVVVRLRQKVVVPTVGLAPPRWVVDPDFDLAYHLRRVAVPAPGTLRDVLDLAGTILEAPLDLARPLWEVTLIEGVEDGRAALITKMSHVVTDGMGGVQINALVHDTARDGAPRPLPPAPEAEDISPDDLTRDALTRLPGWAVSTARQQLIGTARVAGRTARAPRRAVADALAYAQSLRRVVVGEAVPPSPLRARRSLGSRLEAHDVPVAALRRAGHAAGGTLNDAYLAAVCAVLRRYHEAVGTPLPALSLAIPISLRTSADATGGNRIGAARLQAPVGERDPIARMKIIHDQVHQARQEPALGATSVIAPVLSRVPTPLLDRMAHAFDNIDVQASNVPGDRTPRFIAGAQVERNYPFGPLPGVPMMVMLLTYVDTAFIGVRYDRAAVTEPDLFARCLREGFDEVVAAGG